MATAEIVGVWQLCVFDNMLKLWANAMHSWLMHKTGSQQKSPTQIWNFEPWLPQIFFTLGSECVVLPNVHCVIIVYTVHICSTHDA